MCKLINICRQLLNSNWIILRVTLVRVHKALVQSFQKILQQYLGVTISKACSNTFMHSSRRSHSLTLMAARCPEAQLQLPSNTAMASKIFFNWLNRCSTCTATSDNAYMRSSFWEVWQTNPAPILQSLSYNTVQLHRHVFWQRPHHISLTKGECFAMTYQAHAPWST